MTSHTKLPGLDYFYRLLPHIKSVFQSNFRKKHDIEWKEDDSPVTQIDVAINTLVVDSVRRDFPDVSILSEEGGSDDVEGRYVLRCDPLDGTMPWLIGIPVSVFVVSLCKEGRPILAFIADPLMGNVFTAEAGKGAFLNDRKMTVASKQTMERLLMNIIYWAEADYNFPDVHRHLLEQYGVKVLNPGSIAYAGSLVANGGFHASIFPGTSTWEAPAIELLVREAGGCFTDVHGNSDVIYTHENRMAGHVASCHPDIQVALLEAIAYCNQV